MVAISVILWTVIATPLLYFFYHVVLYIRDVRRRGKAVDQFPSEPKHWLWGHLHLFPGLNERGLAFKRRMTAKYPIVHGIWRFFLSPSASLNHPDVQKIMLRESGPNERGLAFSREMTAKYPIVRGIWRLFFDPTSLLNHPDVAKLVLRASGMNEAGLEFIRRRTEQYPRVMGSFLTKLMPVTGVHHPVTLQNILKSSGFNEAGLEFIRRRTEQFPRVEAIVMTKLMPLTGVHHPVTLQNILKTSGMNEAGLEFIRRRTEKFPRVMPICWTKLMPLTGVHHPVTLQNILKTSEPKPMGMGVYAYGKKWIGDGLLFSSGAKWSRNRRLLTPAFHFDILKPYTAVNNNAAELLIDKIDKYAKSGENFEFYSNVSLCTFDVILRCAMSYENDVQTKGENHPYVQAVTELGDLWTKRALQPWLHFDCLYYLTQDGRTFRKHCQFVHSISEDIIHRRRQILATETQSKSSSRYLDFLDILLTAKDDTGTGLTDQEIRDEVDTFLFEGHDTTASSISWTLYSLAEHPEIQRRVQEEVDSVLQDRDTDTIEWEDLPNLKYLTMCIKEAMRLHCPVPFIERELTKPLEIEGVTLPVGSIVDIQIYNLHHNPTVWEAPMEYRPERFLPENFDKMDNYAFIPFSAGPRNCIGQHFAMHEQKLILARLMRRFTISLDPDVKIEKKVSVVMKTMNGMQMKVEERR